MKKPIHWAVFLGVMTSSSMARADEQEIRACHFQVKARCVSGETRVTLAGGAVKRLEVDVEWCGLPGHLGYSCMIDASRGDEDSAWSDEAGTTTISNKAPLDQSAPDDVKVTVGKYVSIDFDQAQSSARCGTGAELPRAIVIPNQTKTCRVWLGDP